MEESYKHLKLAYILISSVMFLPVLLLPIPILVFNNPMFVESIIPTWTLCIALLLMTVVSMDTILYGVSSFKQAVDAMLWVALFTMVSISTLQNQNNVWPLATLFLIHSLRSGFHLFSKQEEETYWWLWLSWGRDITVTITIFLFVISLNFYA